MLDIIAGEGEVVELRLDPAALPDHVQLAELDTETYAESEL